MLIGRANDTARIDDLLAQAERGRGQAILIRGERGIGKSTMLDHVRDATAGHHHLTATGIEGQEDLAYGGLHELLSPWIHLVDEIPDVQAEALRGALALGPPAGAGRLAIGAATLSLLSAISTEVPTVCLIDDADRLDANSVDALVFAARRMRAERLAIVITAGEDFGAVGFDVVDLTRLDLQSSRELLADAYPSMAPDVVDTLATHGEGNPAWLIGLAAGLDDAQRGGRSPLPRPLPVLGRDNGAGHVLEAVPSATREALLLLAASDTASMKILADPSGSLSKGLEQAEDLGFIRLLEGTIRFTDPSFRASVYREASAADRRGTHRRLADLLDQNPRYRDRRAWHLAMSAVAVDEATADEIAAGASELAARRAHAAAAELFERAADITPDRDTRLDRLVSAARSARLAGLPDQARRLADEVIAAEDAPPVTAAQAHSVAALIAFSRDEDVDIETIIEVAEATIDEDPATAAGLLSIVAEHTADPIQGVALAERAVALAPEGSPESAWAMIVLAGALIVAESDKASAAIEQATSCFTRRDLRSADPELLAALVELLSMSNAPDAVLEPYLVSATRAARLHAVAVVPRCVVQRSHLEFRRGSLRDALAHAFEAARLFDETGDRAGATGARAWLGVLEALTGQHEEARTIAANLAERGDEPSRAASARILGTIDLATGSTPSAPKELMTNITASRWFPGMAPTRVDLADAVEAAVRAGNDEVTNAALAHRASTPAGDPGVDRWIDGFAETGEAAATAFEDALEALESPSPYLRARVQLSAGQRLRRDGQRVRAREHLAPALTMFEQIGAQPWAELARGELTATGARAPRRHPLSSELTAQETQVARLIASGAKNKEAAAQLYLSTKTIEYHLSKIYRKLGISSGRELAAVFAQETET